MGHRARGGLPPAAAWGAVLAAVLLPLLLLALLGPAPGLPASLSASAAPAEAPRAVPLPTQAEGEQGSVRPASPSPSPRVVARGDGRPAVVRGTSAVSGTGPLRRYRVEVEGGLGVDATGWARAVEAVLRDPRSWGAGGRLSFQRVDAGPSTCASCWPARTPPTGSADR